MSKKRLILIRLDDSSGVQTLGELHLYDGNNRLFTCKSLEPAWKDNERGKSRVIAGSYKVVYEWSPKFKMNLFELKDVPGRTESKIHVLNHYFQTEGCIGVGKNLIDINGDGQLDISSSESTLHVLHGMILPDTELYIDILDPC